MVDCETDILISHLPFHDLPSHSSSQQDWLPLSHLSSQSGLEKNKVDDEMVDDEMVDCEMVDCETGYKKEKYKRNNMIFIISQSTTSSTIIFS